MYIYIVLAYGKIQVFIYKILFLEKFSTYFTIESESEEHVYLSPPKTYSEIEMTREQLEGLYPHIRYLKYHNL